METLEFNTQTGESATPPRPQALGQTGKSNILTLGRCRSCGSPRRLTRPRLGRGPRSPPCRSSGGASARSRTPPPAWCRAARPPGTSTWTQPGRRSGAGRRRRRRQSGGKKKSFMGDRGNEEEIKRQRLEMWALTAENIFQSNPFWAFNSFSVGLNAVLKGMIWQAACVIQVPITRQHFLTPPCLCLPNN